MTPLVSAPDAEVVTEAAVAALRMLAESRGHLVIVAPPGFGKSSTLRHLERSSRTLGLRTARYPVPAEADPPDIVIVDDAHLLPAGDLAVLGNGLASSSRIIAAVEPVPADGSSGEVLDRLMAAGTVISLEPWTTDEVASLLDQLGGTEPIGLARALVAATGGLPWLVTELVVDGRPVPAQPVPGQPTRAERQVLRVLARLPRPVHEVVLAMCAGYAVDHGPVPPPLASLPPAQQRVLLDRVIDAGILGRDGHVPPLVRRAVLHHAPRHRLRPYLVTVVDDLAGAGVDLQPIAADLVGAGVRDPRLVSALIGRADALLADDPATSAGLYAVAAEAGGETTSLAVSIAEARVLSGDLEGARTALADLTARHEIPNAAGVRVAATVAVRSGQVDQGAALCRWAAEGHRLGDDADAAGVAAYVLYGTGDVALADGLLDTAATGAPGLTESAVHALATAVRCSLGPDPAAALSPLVQRAVSRGVDPRELLPDRPESLAALLALHAGDLAMADSVLARPLGTVDEAGASRNAALRAWTSMQAGRYDDARAHLEAIDPRSVREQPWAWALRVGLARRQDDVRELARLWVEARGVLVGHPVDLYSLLPLGEIGLAAARMHEPELAAPVWNRAMAVLDRLGNPPLWAPAFHWYGIQAAILTNRPHAMTPHATALLGAARSSQLAAALARAGRTWVTVLGGEVDAATVDSVARALAGVGQRWEGARLAGHAAARASDRRDTGALMECARDLLGSTTSGSPRPAAPSAAEARAGAVVLSPREREVAELVLAGMTYRQIGESLYLSAKTVEHHMARIKRRTGAATRSELLERLSVSLS